jgi:hypothetical protein
MKMRLSSAVDSGKPTTFNARTYCLCTMDSQSICSGRWFRLSELGTSVRGEHGFDPAATCSSNCFEHGNGGRNTEVIAVLGGNQALLCMTFQVLGNSIRTIRQGCEKEYCYCIGDFRLRQYIYCNI